ncbi:carboxypeptidase-like regulatory domain-containing protein [Pseudoduganella flava]|uniref:Carboxypeptidase regulatory-like domain-containing protein n=1 Tax=Pseudoduganella flava TaxID=871742 RepID=A0ABX6FYA1_9BURK|nr:carboxypeptidase-like regulatory domain-containing protein [Pseudoduganella flava]QGZ42479.1 hypothetical protein GO485_27890 [Pseudoduganella flava]
MFLAACTLVLACGVARAAQDVTDSVAITMTTPVLSATANVSDSVVTITNTSSFPIAAPFTLTVKNLSTPGVAVAWHTGLDAAENALVAVPLPLGLLAPGAAVSVTVRFANQRRQPFTYELAAAGTPLPDESTVALTVTVRTYSGDPAQPLGALAGSGVGIVVDGAVRAVTDASSQATVRVPVTQQWIAARRAPTGVGLAHLVLTPDLPNAADIVLTDDGEVFGDATLRFDQVLHSTLQRNPAALTGHLTKPDGSPIRLTDLAGVEFRDAFESTLYDMTEWFTVDPDGTIRCVQPAALNNTTAGTQAILVTGLDAAGTPYRVRMTAHLASGMPLVSSLARPPSEPGMDLGGITVVGRSLLAGAVQSTVTDANGNFTLPLLPSGLVRVTATVERAGRHYSVLALVDPDSSRTAEPLQLRGTAELHAALPATPADPADRRVDVEAESVDAGTTVRTAALAVPRGTAAVTLAYEATRLYGGQPPNDTYFVRVYDGHSGKVLFTEARRNGQPRAVDTQWGRDNRTGTIEHELDVAAATADADGELILEVGETTASYNMSGYAASLAASLRLDRGMIIDGLVLPQDPQIVDNDLRRYSMPDDGATNVFHRMAQLDIRKPADAVVTNVQVDTELRDDTLTVLSEAPGQDVELAGDTIRTPLTFKPAPAMVSAQRAAFDSSLVMHYRFVVTAQAADGTVLTAERRAPGKWPLWHAPAGLARYGMREPGGDDWVSDYAYRWLVRNAAQLPPVNDFSGEHGNNLGHATHGRGGEFTLYHFYTFSGANPDSGLSNYRRLVARIKELPLQASTDPATKATGQAAAAEVKAWVLASRAGIDKVAAIAGVREVNYIRGGPDAAGISGGDWGRRLLMTGRVTVNGSNFDLAVGNWDNQRYWPRVGQYHHLQVRLSGE